MKPFEKLSKIEQQTALDAFLVDNQELEELNARLSSFNLFNVLRADRVEIRHSNVLGWLLNPDETHGLGPLFLRRFLSRVLMSTECPEGSPAPAAIELMNFGQVEVRREWNNIDLVVVSPQNKWCLLIENKIYSKESKGQLERYLQIVASSWPEFHTIPIFLTLDGEDPSEVPKELGFVSVSHSLVLEIASLLTEQHKSRIPPDVLVFLAHYLDVLRRITMQDEQIVELCKTIYGKHRNAIDMIVEYGMSSGVNDTCIELLESGTMVECEFAVLRRGHPWFLPKAMSAQSLENDTSWPFLPRPTPIACWFLYRRQNGKLRLVMEVGPISDSSLRIRLLKSLKSAGFSFRESAFNEGTKYTRLVTKAVKLKLDDDEMPDTSPEYISEVAKDLWKKLWKEGEKVVEVINSFPWPAGK